jgi:hypothetical protein
MQIVFVLIKIAQRADHTHVFIGKLHQQIKPQKIRQAVIAKQKWKFYSLPVSYILFLYSLNFCYRKFCY